MRISIVLVLFFFFAGAACRDSKPVDGSARPAPSGLPPMTANAPAEAAAPPRAEPAAGTIEGTLTERIDAPPYSYLRIATAGGEKWAAVQQTDAAAGAKVSVAGAVMEGFESKTLGRRFDRIVFGTLGAAESPHATAAPAPAVSPGVAIEPASEPGSTTIAKLFADKTALAGKQVVVRGKVVKLNSGILGKTWIHLQDGSGSPEAGDHDLAVTTVDAVKLDDVVTVRGPVSLDRDFGSGYRYTVIVENATILR